MVSDTDKIAADEAEQLRRNPAFQRAIVSCRAKVVSSLVIENPTDVEAIRTHQAQIRAIDNLCTEIADEIIRGTPQRAVPVS